MNDIGKIIRQYIERKGMTIAELARSTKLSQSTIDNIVYGRSKNKIVLVKIAKSLSIPVEYLIHDKNQDFDHKLYHKVFNIVYETLTQEKICITKDVIDELVLDAFIFAGKEKFRDINEIKAYIQGIIFYKLKENIFRKL